MIKFSRCLMRTAFALAILSYGAIVCAAEEDEHADAAPTKLDVKVTASWYQSSDGNDANDLNVRGNRGDHAAWLGVYRDHTPYRQARAGYEFTQHAGPAQIVWSGVMLPAVRTGGVTGVRVRIS